VSLVTIGRLGRPHGLSGEMAIDSLALEPRELLAMRDFTWRGPRGDTRPLTLAEARTATPRALVRFHGIATREAAAALVNGMLMAERDRLPDPGPGMAWAFQLVGCEVRTDQGRTLGTLEDIVRTGAHPIYVVRGEREWLLPAIDSVVKRVDLDAGVITVTMIPGLEDL
jgi:16S rRNA processing protein RimM